MHEKRKFPRRDTSLQCYIEKFHEESGKIYSKVVNQSVAGIRLISGCQCWPGDALKIVMASEYALMDLFDPVYHVGMVRWCSEQKGYCNGMYEVGVELAERLQTWQRGTVQP